jgi:hypothetical protein
MARQANIFDSEITHSVVRDAIIQIMQSDGGRMRGPDFAMASDVAARITGSVQKMGLRGASSAILSGNAAFHTLVTQHLGSNAAEAYDPASRQRLLQTIHNANVTGADHAAAVKALTQGGIQYAALNDGKASDAGAGEGRRSGQPGYRSELPMSYTSDNLPASMRGLVDSSRGISTGHVAEAANFAQRIGLEPGPYTRASHHRHLCRCDRTQGDGFGEEVLESWGSCSQFAHRRQPKHRTMGHPTFFGQAVITVP